MTSEQLLLSRNCVHYVKSHKSAEVVSSILSCKLTSFCTKCCVNQGIGSGA